jgi:hypothetical protein
MKAMATKTTATKAKATKTTATKARAPKTTATQAKARRQERTRREKVMPDFFTGELHRQRIEQVERAASDGARRREWLRQALEARRARRAKQGR